MVRLLPSMLLALTLVAAPSFAADYIPWANDLQSARRIAAEQNKLVLVHFYGDTCPPCRRLEANVFSQPDVGGAVGAACVPVKINVDRQPEVAQQFRVRQWPTDLFITATGQVVFSSVSPQDPAKYVTMVQQVAYRGRPDEKPSAQFATHRGQDAAAQFAAAAQPTNTPQRQPQQRPPAGGSFAPAGGSFQPPSSDFQPTGGSFESANNSFAPPQNVYQSGSQQHTRPVSSGGGAQWAQDRIAANREIAPAPTQNQWSQASPPSSAPSAPQSQVIENQFFAADAPSNSAMVENPHMQNRPQPPAVEVPAGFTPESGPASTSEPAMGGYDPVNLVVETNRNLKWKKGDKQFGVIHRGRLYLFASADNKSKFLDDPDRFSPMLSGYDPVRYVEEGRLVKGEHKIGVFFREKFYLFEEESTMNRFWRSPETYSASAHQAMLQSPPMRR
ncbi:MAG: thioredoxin family protein [bacterium]|nr:thioredoxin family protein [bacterium]